MTSGIRGLQRRAYERGVLTERLKRYLQGERKSATGIYKILHQLWKGEKQRGEWDGVELAKSVGNNA